MLARAPRRGTRSSKGGSVNEAIHDCCAMPTRGTGARYDLAVIGAGSAGFSAAITAAE